MSGIEAAKRSRRHALGALLVLVAMFATARPGNAQQAFVPEPGLKGFGIRGVAGATLKEMLANCAGAQPSRDADAQVRWEECAQLRRSLKTQPGNSTSRR